MTDQVTFEVSITQLLEFDTDISRARVDNVSITRMVTGDVDITRTKEYNVLL